MKTHIIFSKENSNLNVFQKIKKSYSKLRITHNFDINTAIITGKNLFK